MGTELLRARDAHDRDLVFAPTHEEAVTSLASTCALSYRSLPLRLYQVRKCAVRICFCCPLCHSFSLAHNLGVKQISRRAASEVGTPQKPRVSHEGPLHLRRRQELRGGDLRGRHRGLRGLLRQARRTVPPGRG